LEENEEKYTVKHLRKLAHNPAARKDEKRERNAGRRSMEVVVTWPAWIAAGRSGILRRRLPPACGFLGLPSPTGVGDENPRPLAWALATKLLTHTSLQKPHPLCLLFIGSLQAKKTPFAFLTVNRLTGQTELVSLACGL
jgi:hypothetical protein